MYLNFVTFNFKGDDIEAQERRYLENRVELAKRLPGLRFYYTGRLLEFKGRKPDHFRAEILGYENASAAVAAINEPAVIPALLAETQANSTDFSLRSITGEIVVPLVARKTGRKLIAMVVEFNFKEMEGGLAAAQEYYREAYVQLARRLPGLRKYLIGKIDPAGGWVSYRQRMAILFFDSFDALMATYESPVGLQLLRDEPAIIRDSRIWVIDARSEK